MRLWLLRAIWLTLPVTTGEAVSEALASWRDAPRVTAIVVLWLAWGVGIVALLAPRPAGLTALRVAAPTFAVLALVAAASGEVGGLAGWGAVAATLATAALTADSDVALAAANGVAYGDERRFPLRTPPALFLGPLPIARALVITGVAAGPLLLADERFAVGVVALLLGAPLAFFAARTLHGLSRRWLVLVPAGVVIVDPLTLLDPVLFVRGHIRALRPAGLDARARSGATDLRLGAAAGTVEIVLDEAAEVVRAGRGRRGAETVEADRLLVAVTRRRTFLATASERRVRVEPVAPPQRSAT